METKHVLIGGVVLVAAYMFWRSRQAAPTATGATTYGPEGGAMSSTAPAAPAASVGGGSSGFSFGGAVNGVTSGSFAQKAIGGVTSLAQYGAQKAVSTTVGSIRSSVGTTVNVVKAAGSTISGAAHSVYSSISSIF